MEDEIYVGISPNSSVSLKISSIAYIIPSFLDNLSCKSRE